MIASLSKLIMIFLATYLASSPVNAVPANQNSTLLPIPLKNSTNIVVGYKIPAGVCINLHLELPFSRSYRQ